MSEWLRERERERERERASEWSVYSQFCFHFQVVLIIYIVIFIILVITSYRKSAALRNSLNRHLRLQSSNYGATLIVDCDHRGRVRCEALDENIHESMQLWREYEEQSF
jgi:hypothetical protein